jgi:hypothetical protein
MQAIASGDYGDEVAEPTLCEWNVYELVFVCKLCRFVTCIVGTCSIMLIILDIKAKNEYTTAFSHMFRQ